eukprot:Pgem_evm1s11905
MDKIKAVIFISYFSKFQERKCENTESENGRKQWLGVYYVYVTPISGQVQLQIPLPTYPLTLISGQISPTYLPLDV